jgi:2,3-dihydroxy-2,3-dihydrophenylpropionate dehydrogenase
MNAQTPSDGGRVVLVTGGASGIGSAVVDAFVADGASVVVLDRSEPPPRAGVTAVVGDVRNAADNERAVRCAVEKHGGLDVFVGNAGVHDGGTALRDATTDELGELARAVLEVDVVGYLLGARASVEALTIARGCMVFTLSDASFVVRGNGCGVAYAAAKHAGLGIVRHLAADLAPEIRVNAVAPGGVLTSLSTADVGGSDGRAVFDVPEDVETAVRDLNPLGVMATPEELAPLYTFLASDLARGMTGEVLRPDGGLDVR